MKMLKIYIKRIDLKNYEVIGQEKKQFYDYFVVVVGWLIEIWVWCWGVC